KAKALLNRNKKKLATAKEKREVATDEFERLSLDNEIKDLEEEASEAEEAFDTVNVEEAKDELKYESGLRTKFWKATFSGGGSSFNSEDWEGLADYGDVIDRYSNFAKHFKLPTNKQISEVLAKLDADSADWDRTQPERFYSTLAGSFPELERRRMMRAPRSGCLVLLLVLAALICLLVTIGA